MVLKKIRQVDYLGHGKIQIDWIYASHIQFLPISKQTPNQFISTEVLVWCALQKKQNIVYYKMGKAN